jgi:hypothetical protein
LQQLFNHARFLFSLHYPLRVAEKQRAPNKELRAHVMGNLSVIDYHAALE